MKPRPRIWKVVKWGGAFLLILLIATWIASGRVHWTAYPGTEFVFNISGGRVSLTRMDSAAHRDLLRSVIEGMAAYNTPGEWRWMWWCSFEKHVPYLRWDVTIPVWFLAAPLGIATFVAWRVDAILRPRARRGFCAKCNYDRTGLAVGAVCPECGKLPA